MQNKKLGIIIIILALVVGFVLFYLIEGLQAEKELLLCNPSADCITISKTIDISHIAVGVIAAIATLGIYLIFFSKGDEAILKRLEEEKNKKLEQDKLNIICKVLDENEARVLKAIKEQDGVSQHTLRLRTDLSKAKVSQILTSFEKKGLIKREKKGKSLSVYLKEDL